MPRTLQAEALPEGKPARRKFAVAALAAVAAAIAAGYLVWRKLRKMDLIEVLKTRE